jgi:hypothetical protein
MIKLRDRNTPLFAQEAPLDDREFLSTDGKLLNLSYPSAYGAKELELYIEKIAKDHPIYETVETLAIETDCVSSMPENVAKFKKLTTLIIEGCRFTCLDMKYVPRTVKHIDFSEHSNLSPMCAEGMDRLVELETVMLTFEAFFIEGWLLKEFNEEELKLVVPIPVLPKLHSITLDIGEGEYELCEDEYNPGWKEDLIGHPLLEKVKHLVTDMSLRKNNRGTCYVLVELAVKNSC